MSENSSGASGGASFMTLLGLLFIGLKLGKVIDWKWIWVLAPIWFEASIVLTIIAVGVIIAIIANR